MPVLCWWHFRDVGGTVTWCSDTLKTKQNIWVVSPTQTASKICHQNRCSRSRSCPIPMILGLMTDKIIILKIFRLTKQLLFNANKLKPLGKLELLDYLAGTTLGQRQLFDASVWSFYQSHGIKLSSLLNYRFKFWSQMFQIIGL